eukprot:3597867-Ditylum_brightwellii.AAC.1
MAKGYNHQNWMGIRSWCKEEDNMNEIGCVGACIEGGFVNTNELHIMNYDEAMAGPDKDKWKEAFKEECECMEKHKVSKSVPRTKLPKDAKLMTSTLAVK